MFCGGLAIQLGFCILAFFLGMNVLVFSGFRGSEFVQDPLNAVGALIFGLWFVLVCLSGSHLGRLQKAVVVGKRLNKKSSGGQLTQVARWKFVCAIWFLQSFRVGEASHPGPGMESQTWSVGLCNPNGLQGKLDQLESLPGHTWLMCETHLSQLGLSQFRKALRVTNSKFRYCVAGAHCGFRSQAAVGTFSGVGAVSTVPARALPHSFSSALFQTGRIQALGFCVNQHWVQAAVVYGFPDSAKYVERTHMTECLLAEAIDRIAVQCCGLRMIAGDFNHSPDQLQQLKRLADLGFCEVQQFANRKWGTPIQGTCKRPEPIDQIWISHEMQTLLTAVEIRDCDWSDHSSVFCTFSSDFTLLERFHWRMPSQLKWPECNQVSPNVDWVAHPTAAYAGFWHRVESAACNEGVVNSAAELGRGKTLDVTVTATTAPPCKNGRHGDFQPKFHGPSFVYLRWVKQLRRIQALRRLLTANSGSSIHHLRKIEVWKVIRNAPGFPGGFAHWWSLNFPAHSFAIRGMPLQLPCLEDVGSMADAFLKMVTSLERAKKSECVQLAKRRRVNDINLLFKDCAAERPCQVDTMVQSTVMGIDEVCPDDCSVILREAVKLDEKHPVVISGQPCEVLAACEDQVWLTSVDHIKPGDQLVQEVIHTSDASILKQFEQVWSSRWIKPHHLNADQWTKVADFVRGTFHPIPWEFPEWTEAKFRSQVLSKKAVAAVGPDGVSKKDLVALSDASVKSLLQLFTKLEAGSCEWPAQLTTGFVSSLFKGRGSGGVDSFRPITVFPLLYRVWSSARARQAMQMLSRFLPNSIRGGIPARESRSIWYELAQAIECSHIWGNSAQGIVLDVCKAFNALPREPVWLLLKYLAFPQSILFPWAKFVFQAKRRFRVRSSTGKPIGSCVGFPEGCALSVFGMALVDWLVSEWVSSLVGHPIDMVAFVDDWQLMFGSVADFQGVWEAINLVVEALDLQLDFAKSFVWASLAHDRACLRDAPIQLALAARDLGAHQNFCKKAGNKTVVERISAMQQTWTLLKVCHSPYHLKAQALQQIAWPKALHGSSIVRIGAQHFRSLRSGATRALNAAKVGSNPRAHLSSISLASDPEAWAILQCLKDARSLGNHGTLRLSLSLLASGDPTVPSNGPGAIFVDRISNLGWTVGGDGLVHDQFGAFDPLVCSWAEVKLRAQCGWPKALAVELGHRTSFDGIQFADLDAAISSLTSYGEADRVYLRSSMDGTLYCDIGKEKHERGHDSRCLFCGERDSFFHRVWQCSVFEECRQASKFRAIVEQIPQCLSCHGWPVLSCAWIKFAGFLDRVPRVDNVIVWPADPLPPVVDLFVDGSCACPNFRRARFASWAVTMAMPSFTMFDAKVLQAGHLSGIIQSSYRAELAALAAAFRISLRLQCRVRIWSDNQAVVRVGRQILRQGHAPGNVAHTDLVQELVDLAVQFSNRVELAKVVSHCDVRNAADTAEAWAFWQNSRVDYEAGRINYQRSDEFWTLWYNAVQSLSFQAELLADIQQVLLSVGRAAASKRKEVLDSYPSTHQEVVTNDPGVEAPSVGPHRWVYDDKLVSKYTQPNVLALHSWWQQVGVAALKKPSALVWVSGIQLHCDFWIQSGYRGFLSKHHKRWYPSDVLAPADIPRGLAARASMFLRVVTAYWKRNGFHPSHQLVRPHSGALACWTMAYRLPWPQERLDGVDSVLFATHGKQIIKPAELDRYCDFKVSPHLGLLA